MNSVLFFINLDLRKEEIRTLKAVLAESVILPLSIINV